MDEGHNRQTWLQPFNVDRVRALYIRGVPMFIILPVVVLIVVVMTFAKRKQKW